jgi:predicted AAA+ superfamily ATPase
MPSKVVVESDDGFTIVAGAGINSILVVSSKGSDKSKLLKATEAAIEKLKKLE